MSTRPTPEEIVHDFMRYTDPRAMREDSDNLTSILREYGYVITHPDDVPVGDWIDWPADRNHGWNLCRAHIFEEGS